MSDKTPKVTRESLLAAWHKYRLEDPPDEEMIDWLVEELNAELPPVELQVTTLEKSPKGVTLGVKGFLWPWKLPPE